MKSALVRGSSMCVRSSWGGGRAWSVEKVAAKSFFFVPRTSLGAEKQQQWQQQNFEVG